MPPDNNIRSLAEHRGRRTRSGAAPPGGGSADDDLVLDASYPHHIAEKYVNARHLGATGKKLLRYHQESFYAWDGRAYRPMADAAVKTDIYDYLRPKQRKTSDGIKEFDADKKKVDFIFDALKAVCWLGYDIQPPAWIGPEVPADLDPADILACGNCLVHLPSRSRLLHTPDFFTLNAVDYDYDPAADCPHWRGFLDQVFPQDREAIDTLHEVQGYLLTPDTEQQKAILFIGPRRSGKGTIGRVTVGLIGAPNVCAPGLSSLATPFGAEQLLGKRLALISDARLSARTDQQAIIELFLAITGEDERTVQRKFKPAVHGRLPLRFMLMTNELPSLFDNSGVLVSRWIALRFTESFYGREDLELTNRLLAELPGILNLALDGLDRLRERRRFMQPKASTALLERWEDLSNPIGAFLRSECIVGPREPQPSSHAPTQKIAPIGCDALFTVWQAWCADQGMGKPGTKATFGKALLANVPHLTQERPRPKDDLAGAVPRPRVYCGLRLKTDREKAIEDDPAGVASE